jgi:hypothetical protein
MIAVLHGKEAVEGPVLVIEGNFNIVIDLLLPIGWGGLGGGLGWRLGWWEGLGLLAGGCRGGNEGPGLSLGGKLQAACYEQEAAYKDAGREPGSAQFWWRHCFIQM